MSTTTRSWSNRNYDR